MTTILLLQDVPGLGQKFDVVTVESDYAITHIFAKRLGLALTPSVRKRFAPYIKEPSPASHD